MGEFTGPPYDVNEVSRTRRTIGNEQRQLPDNCPNIVVVKNNKLFTLMNDVRAIINQLEEEVYKYRHLLAVVVCGEHMGKGENTTIMKDQHVFISKAKADLLIEQYIIFLNRFCPFKISPSTITKVYNGFRNY